MTWLQSVLVFWDFYSLWNLWVNFHDKDVDQILHGAYLGSVWVSKPHAISYNDSDIGEKKH